MRAWQHLMPGDDPVELARAAPRSDTGLQPQHHGGLDEPASAYDVLAALTETAARTGQSLTQIIRYLRTAVGAGHPGHDPGGDPALPAEAATALLSDARGSADALAVDLDATCQHLTLLHTPPGQNPASTDTRATGGKSRPATLNLSASEQ